MTSSESRTPVVSGGLDIIKVGGLEGQGTFSRRLALPLCTRYFAVLLASHDAAAGGQRGPATHSVRCAIGVLPDGEVEVVGVFSALRSARSEQQFFVELQGRGVEAVDFFVSAEADVMGSDAARAYPRLVVLPSLHSRLREASLQVAPSHRAAVRNALRSLIAARSRDAALDALSTFAAGEHGTACAAIVGRWQRDLAAWEPVYCLRPRQRRVLLAADEVVGKVQDQLRGYFSRSRIVPDAAKVSSLVEGALSRIEHRLPMEPAGSGRQRAALPRLLVHA